MIYHVVGRLGSGKTMWSVQKILDTLVYTDKVVYTNVRLVNFFDFHLAKWVSKGAGSFIKFILSPFTALRDFRGYLAKKYSDNYIYMDNLSEAVEKCFSLGEAEEGSRLFIWDEVHLDLNAREWKRNSGDMIKFFSMSRKLGFDVIMISQLRTAVDRQMRDLADFSLELKNLKHLTFFGIRFLPSVGLLVKRWANKGMDNDKTVLVGAGIVRYGSRVKDFYNTRQIMTTKNPPPLIHSVNEGSSFCGKCVYFNYYNKYSDWISNFYPENAEYKPPTAKRMWFC